MSSIKSLNEKRGSDFLKLPKFDQVMDLLFKAMGNEFTKSLKMQVSYARAEREILKLSDFENSKIEYNSVFEFRYGNLDPFFIVSDLKFDSLMTEFLMGGRGKYGINQDHISETKIDKVLLKMVANLFEQSLGPTMSERFKVNISLHGIHEKMSLIWPLPPERILRIDAIEFNFNEEKGKLYFLMPENILVQYR